MCHPSDWIPLCIACIDKEGWGFSPGNILISRVEKEKKDLTRNTENAENQESI